MSLKISDLQTRLNPLNLQYDTVAGDQSAGGTGAPLYLSLLGAEIELDNATALQLSYTGHGTLYAGLYRYLRYVTAGTTTATKGYACFWATNQTGANITGTDGTQYTVCLDGSASAGDGLFAGAILYTDPNGAASTTISGADFGWFQSEGLATVYMSSGTDTTLGDIVVIDTGAATFDALADAAATWKAGGQTNALKNIVGVAAGTPQAGSAGYSLVSLWPKNMIF